MSLRWLPNALTFGRMGLAVALLATLASGHLLPAFWIALLAGATDAADGYLARRLGWHSHLGGLLDPIADKLLLSAAFVGLGVAGRLPAWLVIAVIARDIVIVAGALVWWRHLGAPEPAPTRLGKLNTAVQLALVVAVLAGAAFVPLPAPALEAGVLACAALTLASGVDYVVRYAVRYRHATRNRP